MKKRKSSYFQPIGRPSVLATLQPCNSQLFTNLTTSSQASGDKVLQPSDSSVSLRPSQSRNHQYRFSSSTDSGPKKLFNHQFNDHELEQDFLTKALDNEYPQLQSLPLEKIAKEGVGNEYFQYIYTALVYTVSNIFGATSPLGVKPQVLKAYIDDVIRIPPQIKLECYEKVKSIKPPKYFLHVIIHEAVDLISSDADGLCDPYCKLWISSTKDIVTTSVKGPTLNPTWDESFMLQIKDFNEDILHIEVWDKDPQGFRANLREMKMRGAKGGWLFCREFCQNICSCFTGSVDDFIGKVDVDLKEIYSEGITKLAFLKDQRGSDMECQIRFSAEFIGLRPKSISENLKRHLMLFKMFLQHSLQQGNKMNSVINQWEQLLAPTALNLMLLHRMQSSLSTSEDLLIRLIVFIATLYSQHNFDFHFLHGMIEDTNRLVQVLEVGDCLLEKSLVDLYRNAINMIYDECEMILNSIHSINFSDNIRCLEFEYVLRCLESCCRMTNKNFPWNSIKSEAISWFEKVAEEIQGKDSKVRTDFVLKTTQSVFNFYSAVDKVMKKVFPEQSYSQLTYEALGCVLSESLKSHIRTFSEEYNKFVGDIKQVNTKEDIALFYKIKELNEYFSETLPQPVTNLAYFKDWFGSQVFEGWFHCKEIIITEKIPQIVSSDRLENMVIECAGRTEKQSLSVKSIVNLIQNELVSLWTQTHHPKYLDLNHTFLQALHSSCMVYAECLLDLIQSQKVLKTFHTTGKKKLCVIANNLWALSIFVREVVAQTVIDLPSDSFYTKASLQLICRIICEDITQEMRADVYHPIEKVVLAHTDRKQTHAVTKYTETICSLLQEGKQFMAFEIYLLHLEHVWKFVLKVISHFKNWYVSETNFASLQKCCKRPSVLQGLLDILTETEKLCYFDPEGKLKSVMWTDEYVLLKTELQQHIMYGGV